jgi:hypothetical protein
MRCTRHVHIQCLISSLDCEDIRYEQELNSYTRHSCCIAFCFYVFSLIFVHPYKLLVYTCVQFLIVSHICRGLLYSGYSYCRLGPALA